jgi:hypothetical protein
MSMMFLNVGVKNHLGGMERSWSFVLKADKKIQSKGRKNRIEIAHNAVWYNPLRIFFDMFYNLFSLEFKI